MTMWPPRPETLNSEMTKFGKSKFLIENDSVTGMTRICRKSVVTETARRAPLERKRRKMPTTIIVTK